MRDYKTYQSKDTMTIVDKIALATVAIVLTSATITLAIQEINRYFGF